MTKSAEPASTSPQQTEQKRTVIILWQFALVVVASAAFGIVLKSAFIPKHAIGIMIGFAVAFLFGVWCILAVNPVTAPFALFPVMLILGPLKVRHRRLQFPGHVERIATIPQDIAPMNAAAFAQYRLELENEGFRSDGLILMSGPGRSTLDSPPDQIVIEGFEHVTRKHGAVVMAFVSRVPKFHPRPVLRFLERLPDGTRIVTYNAQAPSTHPSLPNSYVLQLPDITNAVELYAVHQCLLERFAPRYRPVGPTLAGWEATMLDETRREGEMWSERKWMIPAERPGDCRTPIYWTIRMTWGLTPPILQVRQWLMRRRNTKRRLQWGV